MDACVIIVCVCFSLWLDMRLCINSNDEQFAYCSVLTGAQPPPHTHTDVCVMFINCTHFLLSSFFFFNLGAHVCHYWGHKVHTEPCYSDNVWQVTPQCYLSTDIKQSCFFPHSSCPLKVNESAILGHNSWSQWTSTSVQQVDILCIFIHQQLCNTHQYIPWR